MEGDQMKTREALEAINSINTVGLKRLLHELVKADIFDGGLINKTISAVEKARRALSAPARNCDRFGDELDAQLAFLNEEWLIDVDRKTMLVRDQFENWTCYMRSRYARWLMASAVKKQNQKGE